MQHKKDATGTQTEMIMSRLDEFKQEYAGSLVGKLFVLAVVVTALIGLGAAGIVGVIITTGLIGWETGIARVAGFTAGILAAIVYTWITGPIPWRIREYW